MKRENTYAVIMAGGIGSRFWPYSRSYRPKQFLDVFGTGSSLIQMTNERFLNLCPQENIYVVTNEQYYDLVKEQLPMLSDDQILTEPVGRNTAPCIAYASYKIASKDPEATLVVSPSDHAIFKEVQFVEVLTTALDEASKTDKIITIGIKPSRPETGYGYIQFYEEEVEIKKVKTFTEKPEIDLAKKFVESGDFLWNAGIFIWKSSDIVQSFEQIQPEMAEIFRNGNKAYYSSEEKGFIEKAYSIVKNISIDYAIMEKAQNVYVIPGDFGWSDLGSWNALHEIREKDEDGNVIEAETILYDCKNNYIKSQGGKLVVLHDLDGYLVSDFEDVLLVCKKDDASKFKAFVTDVKTEKGESYI